jgi:hypothetical protein
MKTAIIITGEMRSFEKCLPNLHWMLFRHFPGADFYVSTVADANASKANLLKLRYPEAKVEIEAVAEQPDCVAEMRAKGVTLPETYCPRDIQPRRRDIEYFYTHEPYNISVRPQAVLRQLWQLEQGWCMAKRSASYDVVIRCRPDLWFHSFTKPEPTIRYHQQGGETFPVRSDMPGEALFSPWWGQFGGINDRFAIMGNHAAAGYFHAYSAIPKLMMEDGCPLHPESIVAATTSACRHAPLLAEFSTLRENGEMRPPEISSVDLARLSATIRP